MFIFNENLFTGKNNKKILDSYKLNTALMFYYVFKETNYIYEITENVKIQDFLFDEDKILFEIIQYLNQRNILDITKTKLIMLAKEEFKYDIKDYINYVYSVKHDSNFKKAISVFLETSKKIKLLHSFQTVERTIHNDNFENSVKEFNNEVSNIRGEEQFTNKSEQVNVFKEGILQAIKNKEEDKGDLNGFRTYLDEIDNKTLGFEPASFNVIAARPAMGKTALVLSFIANNIINEPESEEKMIFFSLEMPAEQLISRVVSIMTGVKLTKMKTGDLTEKEVSDIMKAADIVEHSNLIIEDKSNVNIFQVVNKVKRLQLKNKIGLVVVDYIQLVLGPQGLDRRLVVDEISRQMKIMAKDFHIPVIGLSQLNRSLEQREDKRPKMSDLRESGGIEQDADRIIFIYRDSVYNKSVNEIIKEDITEIIFEKQRNGPTGTIFSVFDAENTYFKNVDSKKLQSNQLDELHSTFLDKVKNMSDVDNQIFNIKIKNKANQ